MPITIKVKKPAPSNKAENPPKPFIDKLTITLTIPSQQEREVIYGGLTTAIFDKEAFQSSTPSKTHVYAKSIAFDTTTKRARLECKRKGESGPDFRLEFNPRKVGGYGMSQLHATLATIVPDGWEYFVKHGRVSRIDVAIDLVGHSLDSFLALPAHGLWSRLIGRDGSLETIYLGKPKGNQLKIYSKSAQRASQWKLLADQIVRIEKTLRNPKPGRMKDLVNLSDPFGDLVLTHPLPPTPPGEDGSWTLFCDAVGVRGCVAALALLKPNKRTQYRAHLKKHALTWWDPAAAWKHWPEAIKLLQLNLVKGPWLHE